MLSRKVSVTLIGLLIIGIIVPSFATFVSSSTGSIRINSKTTSTVGQQVQAGNDVNLYFGGVSWSGSQLYLFLSTDGSTDLLSGTVYTPVINVYEVADTTSIHTYTSGYNHWAVGSNWINGSIPSTISPGNYYIKAVDQVSSPVAVTDTYITITPATYNSILNVSPNAGPGGVPITFTGSGYPAGATVRILYFDTELGSWNYLNQTTADGSGNIVVNSVAPDLKKALNAYDYPETYTPISYRAEIDGTVCSYANYNEYSRGLKTVGNQTAYGLFGNGTNLVSSVKAMVGDSISISGKWFHPGVIYIRWDGSNVVGTVTSEEWNNAQILQTTTANGNGSFSTSFIVPSGIAAGEHYVAVEDSQTRVIVKILVSSATLQISPASGPGGTTVRLTGSLYPPSTQVSISYLDPYYTSNTSDYKSWTTTTSDASGNIDFSFEIPDFGRATYSGDSGESSTTMSFRTEANGSPCAFVEYTQYWRGLKQIGTQTAYGLYGNSTNLAGSVNVQPGGSLLISGRNYHPGVVYIRFDGAAVVGTVTGEEWLNAQIIGTTTASSTGSFSTYVTIPTANSGEHYLSVEDSQARVIVKINVGGASTPTPTPAPTSNPTSTPQPTPTTSLPTPTIDLSCKSTGNANSLKVEISGDLTLNGNPLVDAPLLLSYSVTGGNTWESLTMVRTLSNGAFKAVWQPDVTGNYLIKAFSEKTSSMNEASKIVNLALTPDEDNRIFTLNSNSTITQFAFNSTSNQLSFIASGTSGTTGYVEIYIPKSIISDISQLTAYIDDQQVSFNSQSQGDSWLISFTYSHSTHRITMNLGNTEPITPSSDMPWLIYVAILAVIGVVAAVAVVGLKKRK